MVLGKGPLADMMKAISEKANLLDIYTNHCIRKTTGTSLHKSGASLTKISHLMKQKNLQSLKNYIGGPTMEDKERLANMLYNYTKQKKMKIRMLKVILTRILMKTIRKIWQQLILKSYQMLTLKML